MKWKFLLKLEWMIPFGLLVVGLIVAWRNFIPGLWLTGWDTLHPELDFGLNFSRLISGVWRGDQGVGALAAHSHMSELPRLFMLWLLHLVFPLESVRWLFILLCLVTGPLGVYFFVRDGLFGQRRMGLLAGLLAGLFYLANPYTVQHFVVPFEMFTVGYAAMGWLFWLGLRAITRGTKGAYGWFFIAAFLASPQAYAAQLWWVFAGSLIVFLLLTALGQAKKIRMQVLKKTAVVVGLLMAANAYWLLPHIYFLLNGSDVPKQAVINQLFSMDSYFRNRAFGTPDNLIFMRNFLFDWEIWSPDTGFSLVMGEWQQWLNQPAVAVYFGLALALVLFGVVWVVSVNPLQLKNRVVGLFLVGGMSAVFLLSNVAPFSILIEWLRAQSGLFEEGLRTPFTKVSLVYLLVYAVGFGIGGVGVVDVIGRFIHRRYTILVSVVIAVGLCVSMMLSFWPALSGNLIHPQMKLAIPPEYIELLSYMKTAPYGRAALMPMLSWWGWEYHDWGYQGPGFLWFGLEQPLLTRDFDRWQPANENFYRQAELAITRQDEALFDVTMMQFQVKWLIMDSSLIEPYENEDLVWHRQALAELMVANGYKQVWSSGSLAVFDTGHQVAEEAFMLKTPKIFGKLGDYWRNDKVFLSSLPNGYVERLDERGDVIRFDARNGYKVVKDGAAVRFEGPGIEPLSLDRLAVEQWDIDRGFANTFACDQLNQGEIKRDLLFSGRQYIAKMNGAICDYFDYSELATRSAYLLYVRNKVISGKPLKVSINQFESYRKITEVLLDSSTGDNWIYIDGLREGAAGLVVNIENRSYGSMESVNRLSAIEWYAMPDGRDNLFNLEKTTDDLSNNGLYLKRIEPVHKASWLYVFELDSSFGDGAVLVLNQGFDEGWVSPGLEHVRVNGWGNGWMIESLNVKTHNSKPNTVVLFYWPQVLEWVGFGLLVGVGVLVRKKNLDV